jgi:hypothetical protein
MGLEFFLSFFSIGVTPVGYYSSAIKPPHIALAVGNTA